MVRCSGRGAFAGAVAMLWLALAGPAYGQEPDPPFAVDEAQNFADAFARPAIWAASPGFVAAPDSPDPARDVGLWNGVRGQALAVSWRNRYGARIAGHLFRGDPFDAGDRAFISALHAGGTRIEVHRWPGSHDSTYWQSHWRSYLRFYADALAHC